jgi:uncharacterized protein
MFTSIRLASALNRCLVAAGLVLAVPAIAQLSSPIAGGAKPSSAVATKGPTNKGTQNPDTQNPGAKDPGGKDTAVAGAATAGKGAGVHSPNSPFAPLPLRSDVVPWPVLTDLKTKVADKKIVPIFSPSQMGLHKKSQRIQGFMMPLEPGERQSHFLLTSVPMSCSFCLPGGPESMVEVRTKNPVKYTFDPVVVEGNFAVLIDDPYGLYYRMTDASAVK